MRRIPILTTILILILISGLLSCQVVQLKTQNAAFYNNSGVDYLNKGDLDNALSAFNKAIQLKPDDAEAYFNRGLAYDDKGDLDRAISDYDQAIRLNPDYADAYYNRGCVYTRKGEKENAIADFQKVPELCGTSTLCQDAKQQLENLGVK